MNMSKTKIWQQIKDLLTESPDQTASEIAAKLKLNKKTVAEILKQEFADGNLCSTPSTSLSENIFYLPESTKPPEKEILPEIDKKIQREPIKQRRKPYTPNDLTGFEVIGEKLILKLDRRNNARSITLRKDELLEYVRLIK